MAKVTVEKVEPDFVFAVSAQTLWDMMLASFQAGKQPDTVPEDEIMEPVYRCLNACYRERLYKRGEPISRQIDG